MSDGFLYSPKDFEFFRDMLTIKFPYSEGIKMPGAILRTEKMDFYDNFENFTLTVTKIPYQGVLVIPKTENFEEGKTKSYLEKLTRIKLEKVKSNGN